MALARSLLWGCLLIVAGVAGCLDGGSDDGGLDDPPPGTGSGNIACDKVTLPAQRDGQEGRVLHLSCQGTEPGVQRGELGCPAPGSAELQAGADLSEGHIRVAVQDAAGEDLVNTTVQGTGNQPRNLTMDTTGAEPGTWTLWVQRSQAYGGEHRVELWCGHG